MTDRPDDLPGDATDAAQRSAASDETGADAEPRPELVGIESVLANALEALAGGSMAAASASDPGPIGDERLTAIEASVASSGAPRHIRILGVAAAAVVVLAISTLVLTRSADDTEVHAGNDTTTTTTTSSSVPDSSPRPSSTATTAVEVVPGPSPSVEPPASTATSTTVEDGHLSGVDPRNFTYPASICADAFDGGSVLAGSVTMVDGSAPLPKANYMVNVQDVFYGDVSSDGADDVIVTMQCGQLQSDNVWPSIVVISDLHGMPTVLGSVAHSGFEVMGTTVDQPGGEPHEYTRTEKLLAVQASGGRLVIRWNQAEYPIDSANGEQRQTSVTYDWDGMRFVPVRESDVVVIPAP